MGLQLTRGWRVLKVWLSIQTVGLDAFRAAIDTSLDLAAHAQARVEATPELESGCWTGSRVPRPLRSIAARRAGSIADARAGRRGPFAPDTIRRLPLTAFTSATSFRASSSASWCARRRRSRARSRPPRANACAAPKGAKPL